MMSASSLFGKIVKATLEGFAACAPYPMVEIFPPEKTSAPAPSKAPATKSTGPGGL